MKPPLFFLVTGSDFARSIKWAKTWANPLTAAIKKHLSLKTK